MQIISEKPTSMLRAPWQVWDAGSLEGVRAFQTAYTVESASFCAERGRFAAGGDDMWVHLHDFATGAELEVNKGASAPG